MRFILVAAGAAMLVGCNCGKVPQPPPAKLCSTDGGTDSCVTADAGPGDAGPGDDGGVPGLCHGVPTDTTSDPNNCGQCDHVCPTPQHSTVACQNSQCGHGPCDPGYYDVNGDPTDGCESICDCAAHTCTSSAGTVTITNCPLPDTGAVFQALVSGVSEGGEVQTNSQFTNVGALGEPTPGHLGGATRAQNSSFINVGGFNASNPP